MTYSRDQAQEFAGFYFRSWAKKERDGQFNEITPEIPSQRNKKTFKYKRHLDPQINMAR